MFDTAIAIAQNLPILFKLNLYKTPSPFQAIWNSLLIPYHPWALGIFTYMNGWFFMGNGWVNIPYPWTPTTHGKMKVLFNSQYMGFLTPKNESRLWVPMADGWYGYSFLSQAICRGFSPWVFKPGSHPGLWRGCHGKRWQAGLGRFRVQRSVLQGSELSGQKEKLHLKMDSILVSWLVVNQTNIPHGPRTYFVGL